MLYPKHLKNTINNSYIGDNNLNKIRALWLIAFPICIAINFLVVIALGGGYSAYGEDWIFIVVPTFFLYLLFLGIEELLRPKKKEGN